jgi:hypothetical protein
MKKDSLRPYPLAEVIQKLEDDIQAKVHAYAIPGVVQKHPRSHVNALLVLEKRAKLVNILKQMEAADKQRSLSFQSYKLILNQTRNISLSMAETPDEEDGLEAIFRKRIKELILES